MFDAHRVAVVHEDLPDECLEPVVVVAGGDDNVLPYGFVLLACLVQVLVQILIQQHRLFTRQLYVVDIFSLIRGLKNYFAINFHFDQD